MERSTPPSPKSKGDSHNPGDFTDPLSTRQVVHRGSKAPISRKRALSLTQRNTEHSISGKLICRGKKRRRLTVESPVSKIPPSIHCPIAPTGVMTPLAFQETPYPANSSEDNQPPIAENPPSQDALFHFLNKIPRSCTEIRVHIYPVHVMALTLILQ